MDPSPRNLRIVGLLLYVLEHGCIKTSEAARFLGTRPRNVIRDLQVLSTLVPLQAVSRGRSRHWVIDPEFGLRHIGILDRISLVLGREITSFLCGTALYEGIARVEPEGFEGVKGRFATNMDRKFRHVQEPARSYVEHREVLDVVLDGLLRERRLHLSYGQAEHPRLWRDLEPLTLVIYRRAVYLLVRFAQDESNRVMRLAVDRILAAEVGDRFLYPKDWSPDEELTPWFGVVADHAIADVVLRFKPKVRRYVLARVWHPTAVLQDLPMGGVELRMRAGGSELVRWILEWGENCTVIEPMWLKRAVLAELLGAVSNYSPSAGFREHPRTPAVLDAESDVPVLSRSRRRAG
jgi:predicted DNA-binding transcriptional regulator YafY